MRQFKQSLVQRTEKHTVRLNGGDIEDLLRSRLAEEGRLIPDSARVTVTFSVPGGGDYSNDVLDIDDSTPVTVTWEVTTREGSLA